MTSQSGGGGGYPGVTSDGNNGLTIQHGLEAGDAAAATLPDFHSINGSVTISDVPGGIADGDVIFTVTQHVPVTNAGGGQEALWVQRSGDIAAFDYAFPAMQIRDTTASAQPTLQIRKQGVTVLEIGTLQSITGALASVTDANAKAVLTSIIAALTGVKLAANNTT